MSGLLALLGINESVASNSVNTAMCVSSVLVTTESLCARGSWESEILGPLGSSGPGFRMSLSSGPNTRLMDL